MVGCGRSWKKLLEFCPELGQCCPVLYPAVLWLAMRSAPSSKGLLIIQQRLYLCAVESGCSNGHADVGRASPGCVWAAVSVLQCQSLCI